MRKLAILFSVLVCLGIVALVAPSEVSAQTLVPCCEGGFKPDKRCVGDGDCPDICQGGFRDGKPCSASPCIDACVGGFKDGGNCTTDAQCPPACVGGSRDGKNCGDPANCPGGSCSNTGSCSNLGECQVSTCTNLCEKKRPKPTPSEPVSDWLNLPVSGEDAGEDYSPTPCP